MKFSLVFDKTGDTLPFEVKYNHELFEFFVDRANKHKQNAFFDDRVLYKDLDKKLTHLHWAISKTNEVFYNLVTQSFNQYTELENYLDQKFLNKLHSDWVFSHKCCVDIDKLRFSTKLEHASIGNQLHDLYPDNQRLPNIVPVLEHIGYAYPFREINTGVHRLEFSFRNLEFKADAKWEVFDNPYIDTIVTNNDIVNLSFGYTYVGRQSYNKFKNFDINLECPDHYNYETLEFAFQLNLQMPESIPFSKEAIQWAKRQNIKLTAEQIPIANIVKLEDNLFEYRKMLYRNSRDNNRAKIIF